MRRDTSPEREAPEHAPRVAGDRLGAGRGIAHIIVALVEDGAADAC
jgi:hypothetical protein